MARSDLLVSLVRAGASGDKATFRSTAETIAAEERAKRHNELADRLTRALNSNGQTVQPALPLSASSAMPQGRDYLLEISPQRRLDDLVLDQNVKAQILEFIEEQRRADLLRSYGLQPRHRLLFSGPPGNGKTTLAEAIAEALVVPMFSARYDMLIGSFLGETNQRLRRLFEYVRTTPCVLLFDEFDTVGKERGDIHETGEIKRVVSSLLLQVDALPSYVVVVAATNHAELLDRAVWRRFEIRLELAPPSHKDLVEFLSKAFLAWQAPISTSASEIARRLGPASYADVADFCLDVRRRYVLALGERRLDDILRERLGHWSKRLKVPSNARRSHKTASQTERSRRR